MSGYKATRREYYAEHFGTVEINNTFYRMPRAEMLSGWSGKVPAAFRFVIKTPEKIAHLLSVVGTLEGRLGCLLVQLPPNFEKDLPRLEGFLDLLGETPAAFEFRHPSWNEPDALQVLSDRNRPLVVAETDENVKLELPITADWGYLRLRRAGA